MITTVGTRGLLPGMLEPPLNERIEWLGPKLYNIERDELVKHPAERRLVEHNRLHLAGCTNFTGSYSLRCARATVQLKTARQSINTERNTDPSNSGVGSGGDMPLTAVSQVCSLGHQHETW